MAKVLMIEDDALFVKMYQKKFLREGIDLEVAYDGEDGLNKVRQLRPAVIVLDLMLPKMSGSEVLRKIREDTEIKDIPVVVMTNLNSSSDEVKNIMEYGVKETVLKTSVTPDQIVEIIEKYLH